MPLTPEYRLDQSRARLRHAIQQFPAARSAPKRPEPGIKKPRWFDSLISDPSIRGLLDSIQRWWDQYPLRTLADMALQPVRDVLTPVAQRNPIGLVCAAFAVGGLVIWARPWRWVPLPALLAGVLPQVLGKVMAGIPTTSWVDWLNSFATQRHKAND